MGFSELRQAQPRLSSIYMLSFMTSKPSRVLKVHALIHLLSFLCNYDCKSGASVQLSHTWESENSWMPPPPFTLK
jgi:hypothetical protein